MLHTDQGFFWTHFLCVNLKIQTSSFNVIYTPEKSGSYEIWVFCGNIPLNSGVPYMKEVLPGILLPPVSSHMH